MLYRVRIDLCFDAEDISQAVFEKAKQVLAKAVKIARQGEPTGEVSFIEIHKCYHDEMPTKPCEIIKRIEV
ncbi:unnamed protein product [marine sediment metagenome]|uniref:Uncharacterized protein n=1 Tax=marine sediment metagenome TaxID=412755 RepID=X1CS89_9ZZZZ